MTYRENAVAFCTYINTIYGNEKKKIDFLIAGNYIKFFLFHL